MSAALDTLRDLFPDFAKARRERNRIRKRYRDNLNALDRDDVVFTISSRDYNPEYLNNRAEKKLSDAEHIIQKYGSQSGPHSYQVTSNEDEVEEAMEDVVKSITQRNYLNIFTEIVFIIFTVVCISLAVFLAIAGIGTVVSQLTGLEQTPNATATAVILSLLTGTRLSTREVAEELDCHRTTAHTRFEQLQQDDRVFSKEVDNTLMWELERKN